MSYFYIMSHNTTGPHLSNSSLSLGKGVAFNASIIDVP